MKSILVFILVPILASACLVGLDLLKCQNYGIKCLSNTTFTFCAQNSHYIILQIDELSCPSGYLCQENSRYPCIAGPDANECVQTTTQNGNSEDVTTEAAIATETTTRMETTPEVKNTTTSEESSIGSTTDPTTDGTTKANENPNSFTTNLTTETTKGTLLPITGEESTTIVPSTDETTTMVPTTFESTAGTTTYEDTTTTVLTTYESTTTKDPTTYKTTTTTVPTTYESTTTKDPTTYKTTTTTVPTTYESTTGELTTGTINSSTTSPTTARSTTSKPTGPPECPTHGYHPGPTCNQYYECVPYWVFWWAPELKSCSQGQHFDFVKLVCVPASESTCVD